MSKKIYISSIIEKEITISHLGEETKYPISWVDGMIGSCAVFTDKDKCKKYSGKAEFVELEVK